MRRENLIYSVIHIESVQDSQVVNNNIHVLDSAVLGLPFTRIPRSGLKSIVTPASIVRVTFSL